jgi:hypothetical protein
MKNNIMIVIIILKMYPQPTLPPAYLPPLPPPHIAYNYYQPYQPPIYQPQHFNSHYEQYARQQQYHQEPTQLIRPDISSSPLSIVTSLTDDKEDTEDECQLNETPKL